MGKSQADAYRKMGLEARIAKADRKELVSLLYEGALTEIRRAVLLQREGQVRDRVQALAKAVNILNGLIEALSFEDTGELPHRLQSLYLYMVQRLLHCQSHFDASVCEEVLGLLETLADGWRQISSES